MAARRLQPVLAREVFALVATSPLQRARETCELAGLGEQAMIEPDLVEWNYGKYEGLTTKQIKLARTGWSLFRDGRSEERRVGKECRARWVPGRLIEMN